MGKDLVRKVNAKIGAKHHETPQSVLGTEATIAENIANEAKDKEEQSLQVEYPLKKRKKHLVSMCKNRKVQFSSTKKNSCCRDI